jgi:hypothetical protein
MKTIYEQMVEAGVKLSNHYSDLYAEVTETSTKIINGYEFKGNVSMFFNQVEKKMWYDIPFAYDLYWVKQAQKMTGGEV